MTSARRLILASASPRREELLRQLGVPFTVVRSDLPEELMGGSPVESVRALALAKARAVAGRVATGVVLGADTVVVLDGAVFGKPASLDDARGMLRALRGRSHQVITGVALVEASEGAGEAPSEVLAVVTLVQMRQYGEDEIDAYVATGEPVDKAGAYAIQGEGGKLVSRVDGCYTNVVGLPLGTTRRLLEAWGLL